MGLLDQLLGVPGSEQSQAMGLLAAGMARRDLPGGLLAANAIYSPEYRQRQQMAEMQLAQHRMALEKAQRDARNEQGLTGLQQQYFNPGGPAMGGTADVNAALPSDMRIGAQTPIAPRSPQFDVNGYTTAALNKGYMNPLDAIKMQQAFGKENQINKLDVKDFTPESVQRFKQSGNYADLQRMDKLHFADTGGAIAGLDPFTGKPAGGVPKTGNPYSDLLLSDGGGALKPNSPLIAAKSQIARAGASNVNVNTDKSYFGAVAESLAKNDAAMIDAARSAPERIQTAQRVKSLLAQNPITGTGAEARLSLNRALATGGLIDGKNVADTEVLASTLASQTLDAIKSSGLGSGQGFTDKDRQFLERARSGNIEMSGQTLARLADLNERSARVSISRGNSVIKKLRSTPQSGQMGAMLDPIEEPAIFNGPSVVRKPASAGAPASGVRFLGFE